MDDMHKPLGKPTKVQSGQNWLLPAILAAAVGLLNLTTYLIIDARDTGPTTVAVNESAPAKPVAVTTTRDQAKPTTVVTATENPTSLSSDTGVNGIDLSKVKSLSPLDPLPDDSNAVRKTPTFKPVQTKKLSDWMPTPGLVEKSEFGSLSRIFDSNVRPLDAYSRSSGVSGANRVAVIIGGLGLSQIGT